MPISLCAFSLTLHRNLENKESLWELGVNQVLLKGLDGVDSQNSPLLMETGVGRPDSSAGEAPDVWGQVRAEPPAEGTAKCKGPAAGS